MANPSSYYKCRSVLTTQIHQTEYLFTNLYLREGDGEAKSISGGGGDATASNFGCGMGVVDWDIYDGPGEKARLVARAKEQRLGATLNCFSLAFIDEDDDRFHKSSLKVLGEIGDGGECAIIGGTGKFAYAQGVVLFKKTKQLEVRALCSPVNPQPVDHTIIDSLVSTENTPPTTNLTSCDATFDDIGQGDETLGLNGSPVTPSSNIIKNKHPGLGDTAAGAETHSSSTKRPRRGMSDDPVVRPQKQPRVKEPTTSSSGPLKRNNSFKKGT